MSRIQLACRALLLSGASLAVGCEFVELTEPKAVQPTAAFHLFFSQTDSAVLELNAAIHPGTSDSGRPNGLANPELTLDGVTIPAQSNAQGRYTFSSRMAWVPDELPSVVQIGLPFDADGGPAVIAFELSADTSRDILNPGADLTLTFASGIRVSNPIAQYWTVELANECSGGFVGSFRGVGTPPPGFTIPSSLLDQLGLTTFSLVERRAADSKGSIGQYALAVQCSIRSIDA